MVLGRTMDRCSLDFFKRGFFFRGGMRYLGNVRCLARVSGPVKVRVQEKF